MSFAYIVKKGRVFRIDGKDYKVGDTVSGDAAVKLESEDFSHLLSHVVRVDDVSRSTVNTPPVAPPPEIAPKPISSAPV